MAILRLWILPFSTSTSHVKINGDFPMAIWWLWNFPINFDTSCESQWWFSHGDNKALNPLPRIRQQRDRLQCWLPQWWTFQPYGLSNFQVIQQTVTVISYKGQFTEIVKVRTWKSRQVKITIWNKFYIILWKKSYFYFLLNWTMTHTKVQKCHKFYIEISLIWKYAFYNLVPNSKL